MTITSFPIQTITAEAYGLPFNVKDYGAVGNGIADDSAAIQAAINAAAANGGGIVYLPPSPYRINSGLSVTSSYVLLKGTSAGGYHDVAVPLPKPTQLIWGGTVGGTMLSFASPPGASNPAQEGGGVVGIQFIGDAGIQAGIGLSIVSWRAGLFEDLYFEEFSTYGLYMNCLVTGTTLGEAADNQLNIFNRIHFRQYNQAGVGARLDGSSNANTSFNSFYNMEFHFNNAIGIDVVNADNNYFENLGGFWVGGSAQYTMRLEAAATFNANSNIINHFSANKPILCAGTPTGAQPSSNNIIWNIDSGNSAPAPTIEAGATVSYSFTNAQVSRLPAVQLGVGETGPNAAAAVAALVGSVISLRIKNTSQGHIVLDDGTSTWLLRIGATNLEFIKTAGPSGVLSINGLSMAGTGIVNSNLVNAPALTMKGNNAGSPASMADLTVPQVQGLLNLGAFAATISVNFHNGNTDTPVNFTPPVGFSSFVLLGVIIDNASASLASATCTVNGSTGGGGAGIVASTAVTVTSSSPGTANCAQSLPVASAYLFSSAIATIPLSSLPIYFRVGTASTANATASVTFLWIPLP